MALASYRYFLDLAGSLQWDERRVDLSADAAAWPVLAPHDRDRLMGLLAGFCVAEWAVADELEAFAGVHGDPAAAACFRAQARDEGRHARFFDRVAGEVAQVPGGTPQERRAAVRHLVPPAFLELFEVRVPALASSLGDGEGLPAAIGLYHMVLEGVVLIAGQFAFFDALDEVGTLPGLREGVGLVHRDERWHIGFGARCLQDLSVAPEAVERMVREGEAVATVWGDVVGHRHTDRLAKLHRRRLRAAGLLAR